MGLADTLNHYVFTSRWSVRASPETVFEVLHDIGRYDRWWPEVRKVERIDEQNALVTVRAAIPYELKLQMSQTVRNPEAGVLEAGIGGDLEGWSRWTIRSSNAECILDYRQEVVACKPLLRYLAPIGRPLFRLNHSIMMSRGQRGLRRYVEPDRR